MSDTIDDYTLAIIGGGSAAEELVRRLDGSDERIVVFEPDLVGGECPYVACMPSKSLLHDVSTGRTWAEAIERRDDVAEHRDDRDHAEEARRLGASIVRSRARVTDEGVVEAAGITYTVDRIVVATGAVANVPDVPGLHADHPRVWTSVDALTTARRPGSIVVLGGGVIGIELAYAFAGFGTAVTVVDHSERPLDDLHPRVGGIVAAVLEDAGVTLVNGVEATSVDLSDEGVELTCDDGSTRSADVLLVATGRTRNLRDVGLDALGIDPGTATVAADGRLIGTDTVWLAGDAAGLEQYTHVANHHARVIADHVRGPGVRAYDDAVVPACVFLDPPVFQVGPTWVDLEGDDDVIWVELDADTARGITDELPVGFLAVAARRSTGAVVAAHGIGPRFDELVAALGVAIDGRVPLTVLSRTIQPFPTVGEMLGVAFRSLAERLD